MKAETIQAIARFNAILTVAIAAAMPLSKKVVPVFIALWVLTSFFILRKPSDRRALLPLFALMAYYFCTALWVFPSQNREAAYFALEVKFSLLLFPALWLFLPEVTARLRLNVLLALVWGCVFFVIAGVIRASVIYYQTGDSGAFFYNRLSWFFHPTYLATYDAFALVVLGRMHVKKVFALSKNWLHHLIVALLIIHTALLESKAGYLCILIALGLVSFLFLRRSKYVKAGVYFVSGAAILVATILVAPSARNRISEAVNTGDAIEKVMEEGGSKNISSAEGSSVGRLVAWKASLELIAKRPLGVGTGDVTDELVILYQRDEQAYAARKQLNPHNQFLQAGVSFGITGIVVLLLIFFSAFKLALRNRDFIFTSFLILMAFSMLFESFFEVQSGVVFFAFFYSFFVRNTRIKV